MLLYNLLKLISYLTAYLTYYKINGEESHYLADCIVNVVKNGENIFWKLSQWITSRVEFLSNVKNNYLIQQLKIFYEKCPAHDFIFTREILEDFYKKPLNDIFESLEEKPEASGSIGQVHIGILKNGQKVAVKVKHPGINENIINLCWLLNYVIKIRFLFRKINFDLTGIEDYLMKQTNFNNEANNLRRLKEFYSDIEYIIVPEVYEENEDFLIMEYLEGDNIETYYKKCVEMDQKDKHWEIMIKFWLFVRESILIHNFFHADLHKGNWKINNEKIIIYDLGIILDDPEHYDINTKLWQGFECRSPRILGKAITDNLISGEIDREEFKKELIDYLNENMDIYSIDFMGDIRNLLNYLNERKVILNFQTLTYLLAFNLASLNLKNFSFIEDNNRSYFEQHLDRFILLKERCKLHNNWKLYEQIEKDEEFFIEENKEIIRKINQKKDKFSYEYNSSDSE